MAEILRSHFGDAYPFPQRPMPKWLVWIMAPLVEKSMTRKMVARNVGVPWRADNQKSVRELGLAYLPLETSLTDMFLQMIDNGIVSAA
jgi:dihydroflavonol-4-reductase